jgi:hypothetical protein
MKAPSILLLVVLTAASLCAQPREGKNKELSLSGSYQTYSSGTSAKSGGALLISPRLGFFVKGGLEIEPELLALFASRGSPVYMLNGNISYNFISENKGVPFLLVGYGVSNTVPMFNVPMLIMDFSVGVLNFGGGVKIFVTEDVALRVEYRYQSFNGEEKTYSGSYSYTQKIDIRSHTVQFGFSFLL